MQQKGIVIWFTGLPSSGKTTIANATANLLIAQGKLVKIIDGDALRKTICKDLGFSDEDRSENVKRAADMAYNYAKEGYIVLVSLITPLQKHRYIAQHNTGGYYNLCFVKCNIAACIERDVKGLYKKAISGELPNFTGIHSVYEFPEDYDLMCDTENETILYSSKKVLTYINTLNA